MAEHYARTPIKPVATRVIVIDDVGARLIGTRRQRGIRRWYYEVPAYPDLLLIVDRCWLEDLAGWHSSALYDPTGTDSTITLDVLPNAPARWRDTQIVKIKLRPLIGHRASVPPLSIILAAWLRPEEA